MLIKAIQKEEPFIHCVIFMKNPLDHNEIESMGLDGLGDASAEILTAYVYYIEALTAPQIEAIEATLPIHDRLLEATLVVFDALVPDKHALNRLCPDMLLSPCLLNDLIPMARGFLTRMFCQLELAPDDLTSKARLHTYTIYFNHWLRVWLKDETPDQSDTMATIDQDLTKLKGWKEWLCDTVPLNFKVG